MFSCWRDLVPQLGVGFTQREVILWAFTTDFFEQQEETLKEIEELMAANPQPPEGYLAQLSSIETHDTRGRLGAVTCPALTLVGEEDILIYPKLSRRLHDELPSSTWAEVPGGHACLWEYPGRVQPGGAGLPQRRRRLSRRARTSSASERPIRPFGRAVEDEQDHQRDDDLRDPRHVDLVLDTAHDLEDGGDHEGADDGARRPIRDRRRRASRGG